MKSILKTAVVGAVAAAFVASVAVAAGKQSGGDQQRPAFGQGRQGGPGGPGGPGGRRGGPLGGVMEDLTDQQREQVKAILESERQGEQGPPAEMKLRQALDQELLADAPNAQKIEELKGQIVAATSEALTRQIAVQQKISQVLTSEQRAKARERIAQRGERGRRGEGGGPRH